MIDFFKSRFFIILLCAAVFVTVFCSVLAAMGVHGWLQDAFNFIMKPFRLFFSRTAEGIRGYAEYFTAYDELKEKYEKLSEYVKQIEEREYTASLKKDENEWLRSFLSMKTENPDFEFCDAALISGGGGAGSDVPVINKGRHSGIETGMPVVTSEGLVGYVSYAGYNTSKIAVFTDYGNSVGVICERSGNTGVCTGDFEMKKNNRCIVKYLDSEADVKVGDRFLTSGAGGRYPSGILVGTVTEVYRDPYERTLTAEISASADLSSLTKIMVITSFEDDSEGAAEEGKETAG